MNKILRNTSILFLISFSLLGCTDAGKTRLKRLEREGTIKHWIDASILFHYEKITGMDSSGPVYFTLDFSNNNEAFLAQFNTGKETNFKQGPDQTFETKVNEFVQNKIGLAYYSFEEQYQINFEKSYSYYRSGESDSELSFGFIYYTETNIVNLFYYQM